MMVEVGGEEGVLEEDESEMLGNVFDLAETTVREVMIPRIDIVAVEADVSIDEATHVMLQGGQSRIPVYDDTLDEVIGVLYAKDLLRLYTDQNAPPRCARWCARRTSCLNPSGWTTCCASCARSASTWPSSATSMAASSGW